MIEEILTNFIYNRKRYLYAIISFIFALLLVTLGFFKTLFIAIITIIGYYLGNPNLNKKLKKIKNILSDDSDSIKNK